MTIDVDDAIGYMQEMRSICDTSGGTVPQAYDMAIAALRAQQEHIGDVNEMMPLMLSIEEAAEAIELINFNRGCPPDKDCAREQNCHECYMEWLTNRQKLKEAQK